ncbi:MAG: AMIN domain-containing protein [Armatimonadetes bacterium]|nr:AMIN domain-containing protein [Armatimonadota bacterium]
MTPHRRSVWRSGHRLAAAVAACLIASTAAPALGRDGDAARLTGIRVTEAGGRLRVEVTTSGPVSHKVSEISTPPRILIDLYGAVMPEGRSLTVPINKGPVARVRAGQFQVTPPIARVVLDLTRPVKVEVNRLSGRAVVASVVITASAAAPASAPAAARGVQTPITAGAPPQPPLATPPPPPAIAGPVPPAGGPATASAGQGVTAEAPPAVPAPVITARQGLEQVPGRISLELRDISLQDFLNAYSRLCGANIILDRGVSGTVNMRLLDVTCEEALRLVLELNGLGFRRVGRNLIITSAANLAPPPLPSETITYYVSHADLASVAGIVTAQVPGIRINADARSRALVINANPLQHEQVQRLLRTLDVTVPQVMIEVRVAEVNTNVLRNLGLNWGVSNINISLSPGAAGGPIVPILNALVTEGKARVLAAPRVATVDGVAASVLLGDRLPLFIPVITGNPPVTTISIQFVDVGVRLNVTPRVSVADDTITMVLAPSISTLVEIREGPQGAQAPRTATRESTATLRVKSGDTIVMSGLINRSERTTTSKVPFLGDIPIIGNLFRTTRTDSDETEVIFLITPVILGEEKKP